MLGSTEMDKKRKFTKGDRSRPLAQIHNAICSHILVILKRQVEKQGELGKIDAEILIMYGKYLKDKGNKDLGEDKSFEKLTNEELDEMLKDNLGVNDEELNELIKEPSDG